MEGAIEAFIENFPSAGVFRKQTESTTQADLDHPVSWVIQYPGGNIGMTYTFPEYRQKGLSRAANRAVIKELLKKNRLPVAAVGFENNPSLEFHAKTGYEKHVETGLWFYFPPGTVFEDLTMKN